MRKKRIIIITIVIIGVLGVFASTIRVDKVSAKEESNMSKDLVLSNIIVEEVDNDEMVVNYFNNAKDELEEYYNENKFESLKDKGKEYYQILSNFLFYNGSINDITISDIKEETVNELYDIYLSVDKVICKKYPDYKLELESKYYNISSYISDTYDNTINNIINTIGIEEYNNLIKTKEDITDEAKSVYEKAKDKIISK